jgi:hypothetical protein
MASGFLGFTNLYSGFLDGEKKGEKIRTEQNNRE